MRQHTRLAAALTAALAGMSILLLLILAGSVALAKSVTHPAFGFGMVFGGFAGWLAWPLSALIAASMAALLVRAGRRAALRTWRRGAALALGAAALCTAWAFGIRPPGSRSGVFTGAFVYGHMGFRPDYLGVCEEPERPLPRGADLMKRAMKPDMPLLAAVYVPEAGWHGSHPRSWPPVMSDSHGTRAWRVRVRGTLVGPGQYGRPALMQYRLHVDSILEVVPARAFEDECGVPVPPGGDLVID